jgi:hypothetical protein
LRQQSPKGSARFGEIASSLRFSQRHSNWPVVASLLATTFQMACRCEPRRGEAISMRLLTIRYLWARRDSIKSLVVVD